MAASCLVANFFLVALPKLHKFPLSSSLSTNRPHLTSNHSSATSSETHIWLIRHGTTVPTSLRFHFCVRSPKTRDLHDRSFPPETFLALNKVIPTNRQSVPEICPQHRLTLIPGSFDMAQRCRPLCDFTSACAHQKPENWMMGVQLWTSKNPTVPQGRSEKFIFHPLPTSDSDIWLPQHLRPVAIQFWR